MRLLSSISYNWANKTAKTFNLSNKTRRFYYYWIRLIISITLKMTIVLGMAKLLDVLRPTLYCALIYGFVKVISGGMHYKYFGKTILLSLILFFTMGVLADTFVLIYTPFNDQLSKGPWIHVIVMAVITLLITIFYTPVNVHHRVKNWKTLRRVYKILTIVFIGVAVCVSFVLLGKATTREAIDIQLPIVMSIWVATFFQVLSSIPIVYFTISMIN